MNAKETIEHHLAALRAEVERHFPEKLAAVARLERELFGKPAVPKTTPNTVKVLAVLSATEFKTAQQVSVESGLTLAEVKTALYSRSVVPLLKKKRGESGFLEFRRIGDRNLDQQQVVSPNVLRVLADHPQGLRPKEVIALLPSVGRQVIYRTLHNLKQRSAVDYDEATATYRLRPSDHDKPPEL